jgi:hypothetical protein
VSGKPVISGFLRGGNLSKNLGIPPFNYLFSMVCKIMVARLSPAIAAALFPLWKQRPCLNCVYYVAESLRECPNCGSWRFQCSTNPWQLRQLLRNQQPFSVSALRIKGGPPCSEHSFGPFDSPRAGLKYEGIC